MGVFVIILIVIGVGYHHHRKKEKEAAAIRRQQIEQSVRTNGDVNRMLVELRGFVRSMNQINQADSDTDVIAISLINQNYLDAHSTYCTYKLDMKIEDAWTAPLYDINHRYTIANGERKSMCFSNMLGGAKKEKYENSNQITRMNIIEDICYSAFYSSLFKTDVTDVKLYFPRGWIDSYELEISEYPFGTIDLTCTLQIPNAGSTFALNYVASMLRNEFPQNRFKVYDSGYGIYIG